ncbi:uncharacterized protein K452DRAFT_359442 [Aplosporella prunicola CBS 121167]|uniref:FHA domain-containing protein n=1 Tax=Aplosporella prunicola CBS 121167 TaxID=1176127 RepID=A0A6A6BCG1_9PEZI|nr:uncharacterized protein K452DRAFT_359442 [Aplosporella prunicola CBS 121167]KAF2141043.1 hypothetical protein K452DRAFT_359442 [Aplosporella prunicola CBS 121167]
MWLLSHDGGLFEGKRLWLRPGSRHLFGRTNPPKNHEAPGDTVYTIDTKTVSRQHLIIEVKPVEPGTGYKYDFKSQVVITDSSRFGSQLDGEQFKDTEKIVGGRTKGANAFAIKLGKWDQLLRLEWQQVNICYSTISSKAKASNPNDPLKDVHDRLEPFDIKIGFDYNPSHTTHVVANKRNTPKGLQALVNAKHIVTDAYVDAIEQQVARPKDAGQDVMPIEKDFDSHWPDAMSFLPAKGKEPVARPAGYFKPDKERESVFAGYTFIFCDKTQFENLQPPISQGGGKALHRELDMTSSTSYDFARYVKNVAGEKGMGEFEDGSEGKGVVVVRRGRGEGQAAEEWAKRFFPEVDLKLGQRSIEQNEFLDAILTNDASVLRRPLEEEEIVSSSIPAPPASSALPSAAPSQQSNARSRYQSQSQSVPPSDGNDPPATSQPPATQRRRGPRRGIAVSRFKGFDDDDDIELSKIPPADDDEPMEDPLPSQTQGAASQSQMPASYGVRTSPVSQSQSQSRTARGRKRPHESSPVQEEPEEEPPEDDANNLVDKLLPAATAMKRRRLEQQLQESAQEREETPVVSEAAEEPASHKRKPGAKAAPKAAKKQKKDKYDPEVLDPITERREMQDEERRKDEESLRMALEGMDIEHMTNLAKVEEMEIKPRSAQPGETDMTEEQRAAEEGRWKDEWNGRKNFKKFRKRRPGNQAADNREIRRGHRVIVTLEEVRKDELSMTDALFESSGQPNPASQSASSAPRQGKRQRTKQRHTRNVANESDDDDEDDDDMFTRTASRTSRRGSRTTQSQTPSSSARASQSRRGGPASAIVIDADDATEMQDVEPEEIAGQPRNEKLVELIEETQLSGRQQQQQRKRVPKGKGAKASTAAAAAGSTSPESTRSTTTRSTRGRRAETPSQLSAASQTQADTEADADPEADTEVQVPRSTAGSTKAAGRARGKRGAMGPPAGAQEPPARKRRGGGGGEDEAGEDELRFQFRRRRG